MDPWESRTRLVDLEGCWNFRDLGGYRTSDGRRVRWRRVYRSDAVHHMTERDVWRVRDELRVRAVMDLRGAAEIEREGVGLLPTAPIRYHHISLLADVPSSGEEPLDLGHRYQLILRFARESIRRVLELVARSREPSVFHCAAGKDRTGIVAAVLLGSLGVVEPDIVEDYTHTRQNLDRIVERLRQSPSYDIVLDAIPRDSLHAEPETMRSLLARVREEYGSMRSYARAAGVSEAALAELERNLLEAAD